MPLSRDSLSLEYSTYKVMRWLHNFAHSLVGTLEKRRVHGVEAYSRGNKSQICFGEMVA